jgi:anti-anti-sigma factor
MDLRILEPGPPALVALVGRLDITGVGAVETKFLAATETQGRSVIVDLSGVSFIGSLGIGMIVSSARALYRQGAKMVLLDPQPFVERVFEVSHMSDAVPIIHGLEEARRAIGAH